MSGQRPVVTDHIDRLSVLRRYKRFLHDGPAWADGEGITVPVREGSQTCEVILDGLRGRSALGLTCLPSGVIVIRSHSLPSRCRRMIGVT